MIVKLIAQIIFYGLAILLGLFGFAMVFSLLKYGRSVILGLVVSALFLIIMFGLYASALTNFHDISFPNF